jgi:hypothetical protein
MMISDPGSRIWILDDLSGAADFILFLDPVIILLSADFRIIKFH